MIRLRFGQWSRPGMPLSCLPPSMVVLCLLAVLAPASARAQRPTRTPPPVNTVARTDTPGPTRTPIDVFNTPTRTAVGTPTRTRPVSGPTATNTAGRTNTPTITPIRPTSTRTRPVGGPTATGTPGGAATDTPERFDTSTPTRTRPVVNTPTRTAGTPAKTSTPRPRTNTPVAGATNTRQSGTVKPTKTAKATATPRNGGVLDVSFRVGREFAADDGPTSIAVADFNNDGRPDAAVASRSFNTLTILLGDRAVPFVPGPDAPATGREPVALLALSLDGDSNIDLLTAEATDGTVSTYFNGGGGDFSVGQRLSINGEPSGMALFGTRIAVADRINSRVVILRRSGDGVLAIDDEVATGAEPVAIAVGDINHDDRLDIVTSDDVGGSVTILLAAAAGGFTKQTVSVMGVPGALSLGDYDVDGMLDFAVALPILSRVAVYHQENGGFVRRFDVEVAPRPTFILLADDVTTSITGDTFPDLLVLSADSSIISVFEGKPASLNPPVPFDLVSNFTTGRGATSLATANIDDDARFTDLVLAARDGASVQLMRGAGSGGFVAAATFPTDLGPVGVVIGDFDWKVDCTETNTACTNDVVTANLNAGTISFLKGNGVGSVRAHIDTQVLSAPSLMVSGDFTGDDHPDLALASTLVGTAAVYRGEGDGTFTAIRQLSLAGPPRSLGIGDFDENGRLDLALGWTQGADSGVDLFADLPSSGSPRFVLPATGTPTQVAFGDVNGDGTIDVVALIPDNQELDVWYQLQDGRFFDVSTYSTGVRPTSFVLADIDEDGQLDAVTANHDSSNLGRMFGDRGGFLAPDFIDLPDQPASILVGDFNVDGSADLAVLSDQSGRVTTFAGKGDGTFPRVTRFAAGVEPQTFVIGQLNNDAARGDSRPDIVVADYPVDRITVLRNNTDVPPVQPSPRPTSTPRVTASSGGGGCELPGRADGTFLVLVGAVVLFALIRAYSAEGGRRA